MIKYKIYTIGNYLLIENINTNEVQQGFKKEVFIDKSNVKIATYKVFNVKDWNSNNSLKIEQILKQDGSSYTENEWETFYTENTGNFNSGAVLAPQILDALNNATSPSSSNPFATINDVGTNLNYVSAVSQGTITSSTGTSAIIPLGDETNAGLLSPTDKSKLNNITDDIYSTTLLELDGNIEINIDNTKFNFPAGSGVIVNNTTYPPSKTIISWNAFLAETTPFLLTSTNTFLAIDVNGNLVKTQDLQAVHDTPDFIIVGWVEHTNGTIERTGTEPYYNLNLGQQFQQLLETLGAFNVEGNEVFANGGNLKLNISSGIVVDNGLGYVQNIKSPNHFVSNAINEVQFRYFYRDGSGNWINNLPLVNDINVHNYDDGSGTLQTIPSGKWILQRVFYYAPFGYLDIYHSQNYYNSAEEALDAYSRGGFEDNDYISYDIPVAIIVVKHNTTDLSNTADCTIRKVSSSKLGGNSAGGGEVNTVSNIGVAGVGIFKQKIGVDFEFKNINSGSNKVIILDDVVNNEIDINVNEANFSGIPQSAVTNLTTDLATNSTNDRNRANHTGTQTASTISDFNTAVSSTALLKTNNLSDVANTTTARNNILPSKTGNANKVLRVNAGETDYELVTLAGGGSTNLSTVQTPTDVTINSDTGTDASISLANGTNAGVSLNNFTTVDKNKLNNLNTLIELGGSYTTTSTTRGNIPEFTFNMVSGGVYEVILYLNYQTVATTTGVSIGFTTPTGTANITGMITFTIAQTTSNTELHQPIRSINSVNTTAGSFATSTGVGVINSPHTGYFSGILKCTSDGTFQVQLGSEVAGSQVQLNQISTMKVTKLN